MLRLVREEERHQSVGLPLSGSMGYGLPSPGLRFNLFAALDGRLSARRLSTARGTSWRGSNLTVVRSPFLFVKSKLVLS